MEDSTSASKQQVKDDVLQQVEIILADLSHRDSKLSKVSKLLRSTFKAFDWAGFYYINPDDPKELMLGPYDGDPPDHRLIAIGAGICGQTAKKKETIVVQDVSKADNYLACNLEVESEIVVPVLKDGEIVAVFDVDSHQRDAITTLHKELLEEISVLISPLF